MHLYILDRPDYPLCLTTCSALSLSRCVCQASLDGFVRLWEVGGLVGQYGKPPSCLLAYRAHERGVVGADVSRWCGLLFTVGLDHTVKV